MNEERERIRCRNCELVQWNERANCRRCGVALPTPIVKVVERVVEKIVIRQDPRCLHNLEQARQLIAEASHRLTQPSAESSMPFIPWPNASPDQFPTMPGGAGDDRGCIPEIQPQAPRSCPDARHRENNVLS